MKVSKPLIYANITSLTLNGVVLCLMAVKAFPPLFGIALMKQIITAKLKLTTTSEQHRALRETQLAYRDGLNAVSQYAFTHGKTSSAVKLHKGMYPELRARYRLPSQLACSVERQVAATYKGLWTKLLKNREHRRLKVTKKRFKGLDKPPHYSSPTVQYTYERDYTFQCESHVSIRTLNGRISLPYQGYFKHLLLIQQGAHIARIGDAKLWYDQPRKTFYLLVSLEITLPEPSSDDLCEVVGIDVGVRYLAVTSTSAGKATFYPANGYGTRRTIMRDCANACSKKALAARDVGCDASGSERDG